MQYSLLCALERRGTADQTTLAADVALDRTTATGALKRLQARGVIERVKSSSDRRAQVCQVTVLGVDLLRHIEMVARAAHYETISALSAAEQAAFLVLLKRLVASHEDRLAAKLASQDIASLTT